MKKKMVMIVNSDTPFLYELKNILELNDFAVEIINDSGCAVKTAEDKQSALILLDMKMPGKSGFQVADDLKRFSATAVIPIIAMASRYTEVQHKNYMLSIGISDCIAKPFHPEEIILKIRQFVLCGQG